METITQRIESYTNELYDYRINKQRRRHLEDEITRLRKYKERHPNDETLPTSLDLHCDENPDSPECRVYED